MSKEEKKSGTFYQAPALRISNRNFKPKCHSEDTSRNQLANGDLNELWLVKKFLPLPKQPVTKTK
jgi:hypothetical protein